VGWWHVPAQLFPVVGSNPYQNAELFGVIRDPYDRMVSEFYYICTLKVIPGWRPDQCNRTQLTDPVYMNAWLQEKIQHRETDSGRAYLIDNGHFTPQYDFIFGPHNVRMLDYVLRMDDAPQFAQQFEQLMAAYELPQVQLQKLNALGAAARTNDHLTVEHLDDTTIQWIHNMYPEDFALGRYARK
jgi:Sulfotransferase family